MKSLAWIFFLTVAVSRFALGEEPGKYAVERYSVIWQSPRFAKKSDGKARPNDYRGWILGGVFHLDGKDTAVIINDATGAVEEVERDKKSPSGFTLVNVIRGVNGKAIRVEVKDKVRTLGIARTKPRQPQPRFTKSAEVQEDGKKVASK